MPGRKRIWIVLLLIVAVAAVGGYSLVKLRRTPRPNVLWITMDSLRADHLGCSGYQRAYTPNIDALAGEGALFTQSIAQSNYTRISVPSTITGKYPTLIDVKIPLANLDDLFVTLPEAVLAKGYATYAILPDWPTGLYQGLEKLEILGGSTTQRTRACLDILSHLDERPFFIWLYYWDPHAPYQPPQKFARLFENTASASVRERIGPSSNHVEDQDASVRRGEGLKMVMQLLKFNQGKTSPSPEYREQMINLYDAEIAFVDSEIKQVLDKIKQLGLWKNTMVILNADHGEAFGEHGYYYHGYSIYEEEVRVPLIVKPPGSLIPGKVIDGPVRNLDIMPTVLDYCGVPIADDLDGQSLRPFIEKDLSPNFPTCIETNSPQRGVHLVGYRHGGYKLICGRDGAQELYHLLTDPGEKQNLLQVKELGAVGTIEVASGKEKELREALLKTYGVDEVADLIVTYPQQKIDPVIREQLKAQGYIY